MIQNIWRDIIYFFNLTFSNEVVWVVFPLAVATIVMIIYFEKYKDESPGWNTHVANSLILLFVSVNLFRYIYEIDGVGLVNFTDYFSKFIVSFLVLVLGAVMLFLNFRHFLPEKTAEQISSPLTLNLIAYVLILHVFSKVPTGFEEVVSLLIIFSFLLVFFNLIKVLLERLFSYMSEMKNKEEIEKIKQEKKPIKERRIQISRIKAKIKKEEREVNLKEKKIVEAVFKKINMQNKKEAELKKAAKNK